MTDEPAESCIHFHRLSPTSWAIEVGDRMILGPRPTIDHESCAPAAPCVAGRHELSGRYRALRTELRELGDTVFRNLGHPRKSVGATCEQIDRVAVFVVLAEWIAGDA